MSCERGLNQAPGKASARNDRCFYYQGIPSNTGVYFRRFYLSFSLTNGIIYAMINQKIIKTK